MIMSSQRNGSSLEQDPGGSLEHEEHGASTTGTGADI